MLAYIHDKLIELVLLHPGDSVLQLCHFARSFAHHRGCQVERYVFTHDEHHRLMEQVCTNQDLERAHYYELRQERVMGVPFTVCGLTTYDEIRMGYRPWGERDRRLDERIERYLGKPRHPDYLSRMSRMAAPPVVPAMDSHAWWEAVKAFSRPGVLNEAVRVKKKVQTEPKRPPSKLHPLVQLDEALQQLGHAEEDP